MATIIPSLLPFGTIILISLPYFVAVIAVIVFSNMHFKKVGSIVEDEKDEKDKPQTTTSQLDNWVNPEDRISDSNSKSE
jgi:flagellar basal body-associated protein FliL